MKNTFLAIAALFIFNLATAQQKPTPADREKIESMKVTFLNNKMNLTPEEAQKFWPVYNQYKNEVKALRKDKKELATDANVDFETLSDAEMNNLIEQKFSLEQKELEIKRKYLAEYKKILPVKKIAAFYKGEEEFKIQLLKQSQKSATNK